MSVAVEYDKQQIATEVFRLESLGTSRIKSKFFRCLMRVRKMKRVPMLNVPSPLVLRHGITLLIGASGSGKSVFLSFLAGYPPVNLNLACGELKIGERSFKSTTCSAYVFTRKMVNAFAGVPRIFLPQKFPLITEQKITTKALMVQIVTGLLDNNLKSKMIEKINGLAREMLRRAHLEEKYELEVACLSGGERQRVELLARLVAMKMMQSKFRMLLLDEPTGGLDLKSAQMFYELLEEMLKEEDVATAVVIATHDPMACQNSTQKPLITVSKNENLEITVKTYSSVQEIEPTYEMDERKLWRKLYDSLENNC